MMCFLYWYLDRGRKPPVADLLEAAAEHLLVDRSFLDDIVGCWRTKGR